MIFCRWVLSVWLLGGAGWVSAAIVEEVFDLPVTVTTIYDQVHTHTIKVTSWRDDTKPKSGF